HNVTVDTAALGLGSVPPNGPAIFLQSGLGGQGDLSISSSDPLSDGGLHCNGIERSSLPASGGGQITLISNSINPFVIGSAATPLNGIKGSITANGALIGGNGGTISITNAGKGGLSISSLTNVSASATTAGAGGTISITTTNSESAITESGGTFAANGEGDCA